MRYLIFVTFLWAFSFSLIDEYLAGSVDGDFAVLSRVVLAAAIFLPLTRFRDVSSGLMGGMIAIGALQIGITYLCLYRSFLYLNAAEVLLFTITTPLFVSLFDDAMKARFSPVSFLAALLAVLGAGLIRYDGITGDYLFGFLLIQCANAAFAAGQVGFKYLSESAPTSLKHHHYFGYFFLGGFLITLPSWLIFGDSTMLPDTTLQWGILIWLGLGASGLGLFLWNKGGTLVDGGTLAVMNNMLIPAGLLVNIIIWNRDADLFRLSIGAAVLLLSLWINYRFSRDAKKVLHAG